MANVTAAAVASVLNAAALSVLAKTPRRRKESPLMKNLPKDQEDSESDNPATESDGDQHDEEVREELILLKT